MTGQENQKRFGLYLYIFHLYLIINKNTDKDMYLVIQERRFLIKHLICYNFLRISRIPETTSQYPVSL